MIFECIKNYIWCDFFRRYVKYIEQYWSQWCKIFRNFCSHISQSHFNFNFSWLRPWIQNNLKLKRIQPIKLTVCQKICYEKCSIKFLLKILFFLIRCFVTFWIILLKFLSFCWGYEFFIPIFFDFIHIRI